MDADIVSYAGCEERLRVPIYLSQQKLLRDQRLWWSRWPQQMGQA